MKDHPRAIFWLIAATAVWGLSFPLVKALHLMHPEDTWVLSCWLLVIRCFFGALILAVFIPSALRKITRKEWQQSLGLVAFGGPGLLLQGQGLATTDASVSAFLTQFYCVLLPIWACVTLRTRPSRRVVICTTLVLVGMGMLAGIDLRRMHIGTGELLTLLAATCFTGQILVLEVPKFSVNRSLTITILSLTGTSLLAAFFALRATPKPVEYLAGWMTLPDLVIMGTITLGCTLFSYLMMNRWQKFVTATEAGLIYCLEPVCASIFALFMPVWLSSLCGVMYANETLTVNLLVGSLLVTLANVLLHWPKRAP